MVRVRTRVCSEVRLWSEMVFFSGPSCSLGPGSYIGAGSGFVLMLGPRRVSHSAAAGRTLTAGFNCNRILGFGCNVFSWLCCIWLYQYSVFEIEHLCPSLLSPPSLSRTVKWVQAFVIAAVHWCLNRGLVPGGKARRGEPLPLVSALFVCSLFAIVCS